MKTKAVDIRPGWVMGYNGAKFRVLNAHSVKPGKGGAFMLVEMRNIKTGYKSQANFRTEDSVEKFNVETLKCQFLYTEGDTFVFMDTDSYEQYTISSGLIGEDALFLTDQIEVKIDFIDGEPVAVEFPPTVVCEVSEADPAVKGGTVTATGKGATLTNGIRLTVPSFIERGEKIIVRTADRSYVERFKD